jgi:hypothetical protein
VEQNYSGAQRLRATLRADLQLQKTLLRQQEAYGGKIDECAPPLLILPGAALLACDLPAQLCSTHAQAL